MFYQSQKMKLECVRVVKEGRVNDIFICRDIGMAAGNLYTLLVIKEHLAAKKYLEVFWQAGISVRDSCIDSFSHGGAFCVVFEYRQERPLKDFYMGKSYSLAQCESVCIHIIMACMASNLPYPVLYLLLKQRQLHLSRDHRVYFSYQMDLGELDAKRTERDCAVQCAAVLRELFMSKASQKAFSYGLLEKKISRKSYDTFMELYKDIRITAAPGRREGIGKRIKAWAGPRQEVIFRIFLSVCLAAAVLASVSLLSQLIFGDILWLRLLFNGFKAIGTESLAG